MPPYEACDLHVAVHCHSWSAGNGEKTVTVVCGFSVMSYPLHKLPDLVEILPEARKFGGCYVFGIQSLCPAGRYLR